MIYIVAILLLILVLSNETARGLLFLLLAGAVILGVAAAALVAIFLLGVWLFDSNVPLPVVLLGIFVISIICFDQYRLRKRYKNPPNTSSVSE